MDSTTFELDVCIRVRNVDTLLAAPIPLRVLDFSLSITLKYLPQMRMTSSPRPSKSSQLFDSSLLAQLNTQPGFLRFLVFQVELFSSPY